MPKKPYTSRQMGDACEMLVAAELTLAGVPALKMPDTWPCYDVIAQPIGGGPPQRVSVKSRTYKAVVLLPGGAQTKRRVFIVPKEVADKKAFRPKSKYAWDMYWTLDKVAAKLGQYEDNFQLSRLEDLAKLP